MWNARSHIRLVAVAVLVALALAGSALAGSLSGERTSATRTWVTTAKQRLADLDVKPAASMTGYSRTKFGAAWEDVDLNGCDTRNDILVRDLESVVFKNGSHCKVSTGTLDDTYTGKTISYVQGPGTSAAVQIDHVVALAAAWRTGAKKWGVELRRFYANDPLVLLAVDGPTNGDKGDDDAAEWLPPRVPSHCRYVARQIAIKTKYALSVTQPERAAMNDVLGDC
jgi:hypothetical protein